MTTAASRYTQLQSERDPFLTRARQSAKLTIPSLMPPEGHNGTSKLYTPFQGVGARGVNNLSAKLLLSLLPPNTPFFRLQIDDFVLEKLAQREGARGEVEKALNKVERSVMTEIETNASRTSIGEALKQLIVAGNVLLYLMPYGGVRVFNLDRFVVLRDPDGNVLEIVVKESVSPTALPKSVLEALPKGEQGRKSSTNHRTLDLFTHIVRTDSGWDVHQEIKGIEIDGTRGRYPLDKSPWLPLRWSKIDGESYGRGYVEDHIGDLRSLEALTKAIVEGSAAAAKVVFFVNPNGTTSMKSVSESESGAVRSGSKEDVSVLQLEKFADFQIAFRTIEMIEQRLSLAFLLNSAIQRNGERVTAEEIRTMAGELEDTLGGVYSILSQEFQLRYVTSLMHDMERRKLLPPLPKELLKPSITTGMEALGRGHDLNKLDALIAGIQQAFGPQLVSQHLNVGEYIKRRGTALGIDMAGLVLDEEQQAQASQQAQLQMILEKLGPKGMDILRDQLKPTGDGEGAPQEAAQVGPEGGG
nr:portal protein [Methylobacterium sp. ZNC0032]